jgi:hypothetical protein
VRQLGPCANLVGYSRGAHRLPLASASMNKSLRGFPFLLLIPFALAVSASCSSSTGGAGGLGGSPFAALGGASSQVGGGASDDGDGLGTSSGGSSASGGSDGSTLACPSFGTLECGNQALTPTKVGANVLIVLDRSGSMGLVIDSAKQTTLWGAVGSALSASLEETTDAIAFGLELFPMKDDGPVPLDCAAGSDTSPCCAVPSESTALDVDITPGTENRKSISDLLDTVGFGGGTPTAAALARALAYYSTGAGKDLVGQRFVMLATDGGPNCNGELTCEKEECTRNIDNACMNVEINCCDSANTPAFDIPTGCLDDDGTRGQVEALKAIGVETFVIGLPGTELYATQLNAFADAGGRPRQGATESYYKVGAEGASDGLLAVFREITTQLITSCDVPLDHPVDSKKLNVAVNCDLIPGVAPPTAGSAGSEAEETNGWWFDDAVDNGVVHLQGPICDQIESQGVERIDLLEGCDTFE